MPRASRRRSKSENVESKKDKNKKQTKNKAESQDQRYELRSRSQTVKTDKRTNEKTKSGQRSSASKTATTSGKSAPSKTKTATSSQKSKPSTSPSKRGRQKDLSIRNRARSKSPSPSRTRKDELNAIAKMYTIIPRVEREDHRPRGNKPSMQIIDHRRRQNTTMGGANNRVMARSLPTEQSALEIVMDQRNELFDNELGYKRRIRDLERDSEKMAAELERALAENRSLKNNINRGPDRADVKKLQNEKKDLKNVIEKLSEENTELNDVLNRIVKKNESEWDEVFEAIRRRQEERYTVIGPFISRVTGLKKRTVTINDGPERNLDDFDSHLTGIEKETNALLRRLKQLKREKKVIDYSLVTGDRKCYRNMKEFKTVGENLNRDLNKYTAQLEKLSGKHVEFIDNLQESRGLCNIAVQTEPEEKEEIEEVKPKKKKKKKMTDKPNKPESNPPKNALPPLENVETLVERQRTVIKATENKLFSNNPENSSKPVNEENSANENDQKQKQANVSNTSVQNTAKDNNNAEARQGSAKSNNSKNVESSDLEKELAKKKRTRKQPEDAGATSMAKLVSPAIGKAPHR